MMASSTQKLWKEQRSYHLDDDGGSEEGSDVGWNSRVRVMVRRREN